MLLQLWGLATKKSTWSLPLLVFLQLQLTAFSATINRNNAMVRNKLDLAFPAYVDLVGRGLILSSAAMDGPFQCTSTGSSCHSPGFGAQVFDMSVNVRGRNFDRKLAIPDGWDYKAARECQFSEHSSETFDWEDYQTSVYAERTTSRHFLWHSSSHTDWYQAINKITQSRDSVMIRKTVYCSTYQIRRNIFDGSPVLQPTFRTDVLGLPALDDKYNASRGILSGFVNRYGTAVLRWALLGGRATELSEFNRSSFYQLKREQGDLESSAALNLICRAGDKALCDPGNPHWDKYQKYSDAIVSNSSSYMPFPPNDNDLGHGGKQWQARIQETPGIIAYEIDNITDLLNPLLFPLELIEGRKAQLQRYIFGGDMCTDSPQLCPQQSPVRQARWEDGVDMPQPRAGPNIVAITTDTSGSSQQVHVVGGQTPTAIQIAGATSTPAVLTAGPSFRFDVNQQQWFVYSSPSVLGFDGMHMTPSTAGGAVACLGPYIYTSGGNIDTTAQGVLAGVQRFDIVNNRWELQPPLPIAVLNHCMVTVQGELFVIGGLSLDPSQRYWVSVANVFKYSEAQLQWVPMASMPVPRSGMSCSVHQNRTVVVIGGLLQQSNNAPVTHVDVYDTTSNEWVSSTGIPDMTPTEIPRTSHASAIVGDRIFVMGGVDSTMRYLSDVRILQLPSSGVAAEWVEGCHLTDSIASASSIITTDIKTNGGYTIHLLGGTCCDSTQARCDDPTDSQTSIRHQTFQVYDNTTIVECFDGTKNGFRAGMKPVAEKKSFLKVAETMPASNLIDPVQPRKKWYLPQAESIQNATFPSVSFVGSGASSATGKLTGQSVFEPGCNTCYSRARSQEDLLLPDSMQANTLRHCSYSSFSRTLRGTIDLQSDAAAYFQLQTKFGIPILFDFSLTASLDFSTSTHAMLSSQSVQVKSTAECVGYELQYAPGDVFEAPLSDQFVQAILNTSSVALNTSNGLDYSAQLELLRQFGDAVTLGAQFGSVATKTFTMSKDTANAAFHANFNEKEAASKSFLCFWGKSSDQDASVNVQADLNFQRYVTDNTTQCTPVCPPQSANVSRDSRSWQDSVYPLNGGGVAGPIRYITMPWTELLTPERFPANASQHVEQLRSIIEDLVTSGKYCDSVPLCQSVSQFEHFWTPAETVSLSDAAVHATNSELWVIGGRDTLSTGAIVSYGHAKLYNLTTDTAAALPLANLEYSASMSAPKYAMAFAGNSSYVWVAGGILQNGTLTDVVETLDTTNRVWRQRVPLTTPVAYAAAAVVNGAYMVVGGLLATGALKCGVQILHEPFNTWHTGLHPSTSTCVQYASAVSLNGTLFLFGGCSSVTPAVCLATPASQTTCSSTVTSYTPGTDTWFVGWSLPEPMCSPSASVVNDTHAIITTTNSGATHVYLWNSLNGEFSPLPTAPFASSTNGAAYHRPSGRLFVLGGGFPSQILTVTRSVPANTNVGMDIHATTSMLSVSQGVQSSPNAKHQQQPQARQQQTQQQQQQPLRSPQSLHRRDQPKKAFPYVHHLAYGYNPMLGDPFNAVGVDPGVSRFPIYDITSRSDWDTEMLIQNDNFTWLLPSGMDGSGAYDSSCSYASNVWRWSDSSSYAQSMSSLFPLAPATKWGWPRFFGYEYSAELDYQWIARETLNASTEVFAAVGVCAHNTVRVSNVAGLGLNFSSSLIFDLRSLSEILLTKPINNTLAISTARQFLIKYGTHVPSEITFGALVAQISAMASGEINLLAEAGVNVNAAAMASLLIFFKGEVGGSGQAVADAVADFRAAITRNFTVCIPRCPPASVGNSTPLADDWFSQLALPAGEVTPVKTLLTSIVDVLDAARAKLPMDLLSNFDAVLAILSQVALSPDYCKQTVDCHFWHSDPAWVVDTSVVSHSDAPQQVMVPVSGATTATLPDGTMLLIGGQQLTTENSRPASSTKLVHRRDLSSGYNGVQAWSNGTNGHLAGWGTRLPLLTGRIGAAAVVLGGKVVICGGQQTTDTGPGVYLNTCEYSDNNGTSPWQYLPFKMKSARAYFVLEVFESTTMMAVGGVGFVNSSIPTRVPVVLDSIEMYDVGGTTGWATARDVVLPEPIYSPLSTMWEGKLLIFGGLIGLLPSNGGSTSISVLQVHKTNSTAGMMVTVNKFQTDIRLPWALSSGFVVPLKDNTSLMMIGGMAANVHSMADVYPLVPTSNTLVFDTARIVLSKGPTCPWTVTDTASFIMSASSRYALMMGGTRSWSTTTQPLKTDIMNITMLDLDA